MKLVIDIPAETYKAISEWDEPKPKYAAEYMLYQFVKNGKRIEQTNCTDAISRSEAIRIASGYCHWTNIPTELAKLPSVSTEKTKIDWNYGEIKDLTSKYHPAILNKYLDEDLHIKNSPSVSTEKVSTDHWEKLWDKLYNWLNDTRLNVAPDETVKDEIERNERLAQADMLDEVMECMLDLESKREEGETD